MVFGGLVFYPGERAREVLRFYARLRARRCPTSSTTLVNLATAPPAPFLPEDVHGTADRRLIAGVHGGPRRRARGARAAARRSATRSPTCRADAVRRRCRACSTPLDPRREAQLLPRRVHRRTRRRHASPGSSLRTSARRRCPRSTSSTSVVRWPRAAGARRSATRRAVRVNVIARTPDAEGFDDNVALGARDGRRPRAGPAAPAHSSTSWATPPTPASAPPTATRTTTGWSRSSDRYDPTNLFRLNQNISPHRRGPTAPASRRAAAAAYACALTAHASANAILHGTVSGHATAGSRGSASRGGSLAVSAAHRLDKTGVANGRNATTSAAPRSRARRSGRRRM